MNSRYGIFLATIVWGTTWASDVTNRFTAIDIQPPFDKYLVAQHMLMEYTGATVIKLKDGRKVLLSVASTTVNDNSAKDHLRRLKVCRSKALANVLAETKGIQVASASKIEDRTQVTIENGKEAGKSIEDVL